MRKAYRRGKRERRHWIAHGPPGITRHAKRGSQVTVSRLSQLELRYPAIRTDPAVSTIVAPRDEAKKRREAGVRVSLPTNAFVESFNGRFRDESLNVHWFLSIADARAKIEAWRRDYNESRPHTSLGWMMPVKYAAAAAAKVAE